MNVYGPVLVLAVTIDGTNVRAVFSDEHGRTVTVVWRKENDIAANQAAKTLAAWRNNNTVLSLVEHEDQMSAIDEYELVRRACA